MTNIALYIIYFSVFLLIYAFFLYPVVLRFVSKLIKETEYESIKHYPNIVVVLSVFNEERFVEEAIRTVFSTDYPREKIRMLVGSDGSSDKTNDIVKSLLEEFPEVEFHEYGRSGKNMVLNKLLKDNIKEDYIFYMDADCRLEKDTIITLLSTLKNETFGAVIAAMKSLYADDNSEESGEKGEGLYQKYETALKINESRIYSTASSCGLFYGIKAKFYTPLPNPNVCDDLYPLMQIAKRKNRIVYLKDAVAYEYREKNLSNEFNRRKRIIAGAWATIFSSWKILLPFSGWYGFAYSSHKTLRFLTPFFLLFIMLATPLIYNNDIFYPLLACQSLFYGLAVIGMILEKSKINVGIIKIFYYFVSQNIAIFLGFFKFLTSKNISQWTHKV